MIILMLSVGIVVECIIIANIFFVVIVLLFTFVWLILHSFLRDQLWNLLIRPFVGGCAYARRRCVLPLLTFPAFADPV